MPSRPIDRGRGRPKRWQIKYRADDGAQRSQSFATHDEALAFASRIDVALRDQTYVDSRAGQTPFGEYAERVFDSWLDLRPSSRARYRGMLDKMILPRFQRSQLAKIDRLALQGWIAKLSADGYAPGSIRQAVWIVSRVLDEAVADRKIPANHSRGLNVPQAARHEARFLTPAEVTQLADVIDVRWRALVFVAAICGLRIGELLALRWRDVNMLRRTVEIRETVTTDDDGKTVTGPPKTRAARRRVPMPAIVVDELAAHAARAGRPAPGDLVFPAPQGGLHKVDDWRYRIWRPAVVDAGLDGLVPHELRHSAIAAWIEAGVSVKAIATRAGHASVATILDTYGHLLPDEEARSSEAIDRLYRAASSDT
jgi:integrase